MKKGTILLSGLLLVVVLGALGYVLVARQNNEVATTTSSENLPPITKEDLPKLSKQAKEGRYVDYSEAKRSDTKYAKTILFFHAPWCVECRGFDKAISASDIPSGTQILKVDYDSSKDLRKQYGVTIQSTFVRVANNGSKVSLWNGYGKDKSVDAVLQNT